MAQDINSVVLVGRLGHDMSVTTTPLGVPVGRISLASTRRTKKDQEWIDETNWFDVTLFGSTVTGLTPYLKKGQQVCVQGSLKYDAWEKDGQKHNKVSITCTNIQLIGSRSEGSSRNEAPTPEYAPQTQYNGQNFDEDIPFKCKERAKNSLFYCSKDT